MYPKMKKCMHIKIASHQDPNTWWNDTPTANTWPKCYDELHGCDVPPTPSPARHPTHKCRPLWCHKHLSNSKSKGYLVLTFEVVKEYVCPSLITQVNCIWQMHLAIKCLQQVAHETRNLGWSWLVSLPWDLIIIWYSMLSDQTDLNEVSWINLHGIQQTRYDISMLDLIQSSSRYEYMYLETMHGWQNLWINNWRFIES